MYQPMGYSSYPYPPSQPFSNQGGYYPQPAFDQLGNQFYDQSWGVQTSGYGKGKGKGKGRGNRSYDRYGPSGGGSYQGNDKN